MSIVKKEPTINTTLDAAVHDIHFHPESKTFTAEASTLQWKFSLPLTVYLKYEGKQYVFEYFESQQNKEGEIISYVYRGSVVESQYSATGFTFHVYND